MLVKKYSWPGNVRELKNVADRLDALCDNDIIVEEDIVKALRLSIELNIDGEDSPDHGKLLPRLEERLIRETLRKYAGNRSEAAAALGMSPTTLWRRMKKFGL